LRNLLNTALVAFEVVKSGNVGVGGSTGAVLHRNLLGARDLVVRSLDEVRTRQGVQNREQLLVSALIEDPVANGRAIVSDLLELAMNTHGGLDRWRATKTLDPRTTLTGASFESKTKGAGK
jgi:hypothetical protein